MDEPPRTPARNEPSRTPVRLLAASRFVSVTGGQAALVALGITVFDETKSFAWFSAYFLVTIGLTGLLGPVFGMVADRFDRQRVMVVSELAGAALFTALIFVIPSPSAILLLTFLASAAHEPFHAASSAAIPALAGAGRIEWANSLVSTTMNIGRVAGPLLGASLVVVLGIEWILAFNVATFLASAALLSAIRGSFRERHEPEAAPGAGLRGALAGYRHLLSRPALRAVAFAWAIDAFALDVALVVDLEMARDLGAGDPGYGALSAFWAMGAAAGALAGRRLVERTEPRAVLLGIAAISVASLAIAVSPVFWLVLVLTLAAAVGDAYGAVAGFSFIQRRSPDAVRGRVFAAVSSLWYVANMIAFGLTAIAAEHLGWRGIYVLGSAAAAVAFVVALPVLRERAGRGR